MHSPGINGVGELRGQPAETQICEQRHSSNKPWAEAAAVIFPSPAAESCGITTCGAATPAAVGTLAPGTGNPFVYGHDRHHYPPHWPVPPRHPAPLPKPLRNIIINRQTETAAAVAASCDQQAEAEFRGRLARSGRCPGGRREDFLLVSTSLYISRGSTAHSKRPVTL